MYFILVHSPQGEHTLVVFLRDIIKRSHGESPAAALTSWFRHSLHRSIANGSSGRIAEFARRVNAENCYPIDKWDKLAERYDLPAASELRFTEEQNMVVAGIRAFERIIVCEEYDSDGSPT